LEQNLKYRNKSIQIACDGGAATGKSTGAKMISKKYNLKFLSSGLLYRYASFLILKYKPKNYENFLKKNFKNFNLGNIKKNNLHTQEISKHAAHIAKVKKVRNILKKYQINFTKKFANCCIEGRDISTNILPNSDLKFFFKCNLKIASVRRFKELKKKNSKIKLADVKKALRIRNISDIKRKNSPLLKHRDSIVIDTSNLDKKAMLAKMSKYVEKIIKKKYEDRSRIKK
jgi:cytidylate kinase